MKHFDKDEYTHGADGMYRRIVRFSDRTEIIVRDHRGSLVRVERLNVTKTGEITASTTTK